MATLRMPSRSARWTIIGAGIATALSLSGCTSGTSGVGSSTDTAARGTSSSSSTNAAAPSTPSSPATSGGSSSSAAADPASQVRAALAAAQSARTVHLRGSGIDSGKPLAFDEHYGTNGSKGWITLNDTKISVIAIGSTAYFKAPDKFWRAQAGAQADTVLRVVGGKWVKAPAGSSEAGGFTDFTDRAKLFAQFTKSFEKDGASGLRRAGTSTVNGVRTTTYTQSGTDGKNTIDIAASGTPYPIRLVDGAVKDGGTLSFSEWNKPYTVSAPPAGQTVTLPS